MNSEELGRLLGLTDLEQLLPVIDRTILEAAMTGQPYLDQPLKRVLASSGKRLRPLLVCAVAQLYGKPATAAVFTAAAAIELVHIGSLVHDDIIDEAEVRWNRPTIHAREGLDVAIVIGDYLLTRAANQAARLNAQAAVLVTEAIAKLCDGELAETVDSFNVGRQPSAVLQTIDGKTGMLISTACQLGCLVAGAVEADQRAWRAYGQSFGRGFQLIDDVLDFVSTPELFGKPVGNDVKKGVYTWPVLLALAGPQKNKVAALLKQPNIQLTELLVSGGYLQETIALAKRYALDAKKALKQFKTPLTDLPERYIERSLQQLVADEYRSMIEF